jgi:P27 family predicted phage terminase small subunit
MAANAGRKSAPATLKLIGGRGDGKDSGGREVKPPPGFIRLPPTKPEYMSSAASAMWDQIVEELQRLQVTKPLDGAALEMACETYARWQAARDMRVSSGLLARNSQGEVTAPWVGIEERASKEFRAWCSEFGLTPAAESKIGGGGDDGADNPFAGGA